MRAWLEGPGIRGWWVAIAMAVLPWLAGEALAQDYTHPRDMSLPESDHARPNPDDLRLTLDNGLVAYVARDDRAPLTTYTVFVSGGTGDGEPGDAQVVAAALRRGPSAMAAGAFGAALDEMAAVYTVTVTHEEMEISLDVPSEDGLRALELLAAVLESPAFGTAGAGGPGRTSQAEGIDWAASIAGAIGAFNSRLYQGHPFGRTPSSAEMDAARSGGGQRFHATYFVPSNMTMAASGEFQEATARVAIEAEFGGWRTADRPPLPTFPAVQTTSPRAVLEIDAQKLQGWAVIGHELPMVPAADEAALDVMNYILGAYHLDARLFRAAREQRGLTNDNSSFLQPAVRGPGTYTFHTYGRPEAVRLLVDVTFQELDRIRDTQASEEEIFVAKGALIDGTHASRYATGQAAAHSYALEWLRRGNHDWSASYPERITNVTLAQVQEAARTYIHPERMIVSVVGPLELIAAAPAIETEPQLDAWGRVERVDGGR